MRLVLPVLYLKESSNYKLDTDLELNMSDYNQVEVTFYNIDSVEPLSDKPNRSAVCVGNKVYDINLTSEEVDKRIMKQRKLYGTN